MRLFSTLALTVTMVTSLTFAQTPTATPISGSKPTIFVAPLKGDLSQIQGWQPALGEGLAEMMVTELMRSGKFQVLESTQLNNLIDEIKMGEQGYVNKSERVEKGGFAGADYMFVGKVTRFGSKKNKIGLGGFIPGSGGDLAIKTSTSEVQINWRIVDASSRIAKASGSGKGKETGLGFDIGVAVDGHGGKIGFQNEEFMNSALGKATVKALNVIMADVHRTNLPISARRKQKMAEAKAKEAALIREKNAIKNTPGKVLAVPTPGIVIISVGSKQGWKVGDKVRLYKTENIKNEEGVVVFTEEKLVGEVVLESVQESSSKARSPEGLTVEEGWTVKAN